jgi:sporulation protein YlmC with PRC-barrel domain
MQKMPHDYSEYNEGLQHSPAVSVEEESLRRVVPASTLNGNRVRNSAGQDLGRIEEIMLDISSGRIAYVVLSFGGFLGIGGKLFAIPWQALVLDEDDHQFILNLDKDRLERAPGFDKDNWPDMADPRFGRQVFSYYGYQPYWDER